ncbi:hypothetical protein LCGC14_3091330, partial [marine sediment metagenome]
AEGMLIIPILIDSCMWKEYKWISETQMLPRDGKCVAVNFMSHYNTVFLDVANRIKEFVEAGLKAEAETLETEWERPSDDLIDIDRLPSTGAKLFGRKDEIKLLDETWKDGEKNILSFVAWGGVGKSTLINKWLEYMDAENYRGAKRVYTWSFYSQGTSERVTSADAFVAHALEWFGDEDPKAGSPWDKGQRLAELIANEKTLLILDGMEPLQSGLDFEKGKIKDAALEVMLRGLAKKNLGLCVITTRLKVPEFDHEKYEDTVESVGLEMISKEAGRSLLRVEGVRGTDAELEGVVEAFGCHALAVNLLGVYLHGIEGHAAKHVAEIPDLPEVEVDDGKHPRRVIEAI